MTLYKQTQSAVSTNFEITALQRLKYNRFSIDSLRVDAMKVLVVLIALFSAWNVAGNHFFRSFSVGAVGHWRFCRFVIPTVGYP